MTNKSLWAAASILLIFSLLLTACGASPTPAAAQPLTLTDGLGRAVTLDQPAQRIISLAPSNTEILFALGAGPQVVGRDEFSDYPAEAAQLPNIGGGFGNLNMESIVSLSPDLVLAADIISQDQIQQLEGLGLPVYALPNPVTFEQLYANLETVARLTGREAEAATLVESLKTRVNAVTEKTAGVAEEDRLLVFYELDSSDPNAPFTSGPGTFIEMLITSAGGRNLGSSLQGAWVQVSLEELVSQNPDVIVLGDYTWGGVTPEQVTARPGWETLAAVQNERVYTFDDNLVSRPGPRMVDGLEAMARLLHPDIFK